MKLKLTLPMLAYDMISRSNYKQKDHLYYICSLILRQRCYYKQAYDGSDYVDISQQQFTKVISNSAQLSKAKAFLLVNKIIEVDGKYKVGYKALGYRFVDKIILNGCTEVPVTNAIVEKNIFKEINSHRSIQGTATYRKYFMSNFGIDKNAAISWIRNSLLNELKTIAGKKHHNTLNITYSLLCKTNGNFSLQTQVFSQLNISNSKWKKQLWPIIAKHVHYWYSVSAISNGYLYFTRNTTNKRIDTNLTSLKSDLRRFINGSANLVQIDICNSQPVFLYFLLQLSKFNSVELQNYGTWVLSGQFYENFQDAYYKLTSKKLERQNIKDMMFRILFSKNRQFAKQKQIFKIVFPDIHKWICEYKRDDHSSLAIALQKMESKICIDKVCKRLDASKIAYYTIHDSWIIDHKHTAIVKKIAEQEFERQYGDHPQLKTTKLEE